MAKSTSNKPSTFPNTAAGRTQAYSQAVKQGESSITFKIPASKPPASSGTKKR